MKASPKTNKKVVGAVKGKQSKGKGKGKGKEEKETNEETNQQQQTKETSQQQQQQKEEKRKWFRFNSVQKKFEPIEEALERQIDKAFESGVRRARISSSINEVQQSTQTPTSSASSNALQIDFLRMTARESAAGNSFAIKFEGPFPSGAIKPTRKPIKLGPTSLQRAEIIQSKTANIEIEEEKANCLKRFEELVANCKQNSTKFEDDEFPHGPWAMWRCPALPPNSNLFPHPESWRRASELFSGCRLNLGHVDPRDLEEGLINTKWFLGPLAIACIKGICPKTMFLATNEDLGIYALSLFFNNKWIFVIVDDFIPCDNTGKPLGSFNKDKSKFWVAILEKAIAKIHGCYQSIDGGLESFAILDLFGSFPLFRMKFTDPSFVHDPDVNKSKTWSLLLSKYKNGSVITCFSSQERSANSSSNSADQKMVSHKGILLDRVHLVLKMIEIEGLRLIQLFNPYGKEHWTGKWADNDPVWREKLHIREKLDHSFTDEGVFCMEWSDFFHTMTNVSCDIPFDPSWNISTVCSMWDFSDKLGTDLCGGSDQQWIKNPQFGLAIKEPSNVIINLSQPSTKPYNGEDDYPIGLNIKICVTTSAGKWKISDPLGCVILHNNTNSTFERSVSLEAKLSPQEDPYTIVVSTNREGFTMPFVLKVVSNHSFELLDSLQNGVIEKTISQSQIPARFSDIFSEWFQDCRKLALDLDVSEIGQPKAVSFFDQNSKTRLLLTSNQSRYQSIFSEIKSAQPHPKRQQQQQQQQQTIQIHQPPNMQKLIDHRKLWDKTTHLCQDLVCVDFSKSPYWNEIHVSMISDSHNEQMAPISEHSFAQVFPSSAFSSTEVESLWKFLESKGLIKDRKLFKSIQCRDPSGKTWIPLTKFEDLIAGTTSPVLELRVCCILAHPPEKLELSSLALQTNEEGTTILSTELSWIAPNVSDPTLAPLSFLLSVKLTPQSETTSNSIPSETLNIELPATTPNSGNKTYKVKVENLIVSRTYEFFVFAQNAAGKGESSPSLIITPSEMLSKSYITVLGTHKNSVLTAIYSKTSNILFTGSRDHTIIKWTLSSSQNSQNVFMGHTGAVYCLAVTEDGNKLFSGSEDKNIRVWDVNSCKCITALGGHKLAVNSLCVSSVGSISKLFSGSADDTIIVWDIATLSCIQTINLKTTPTILSSQLKNRILIGLKTGFGINN